MVMDAARAVAMPSLSPATVAARPSSRRLHKVAAMATQKPTSGTRRLLTNVEKLRLLTKAEKAGLLSAAERAGLSLSAVERLGLLSKAEELEVLSAATDPGTPGALLGVALLLLAAGPAVVYLVPEEYPWEVAVQAVVALACVVGGSTAFAASSFVSKLQSSSS
ncbi:hypothetical protein OsJ_36614 [Oryza sativa Japonica Group]|uniref:Uncharacterized protein n=1 Tax=Oryza sativa subsp. japonica TaxID=39947 RepID=B9GDW9_ORYSJ|nr:hypothetical protein OsJ_36614 [Oryza sativa Japonica Group]